MKKVCVCGGGNIGHVAAAFAAARGGCEVSVLTRRPQLWSRQLSVDTPDGSSFTARLAAVSSDPAEVVPAADIVLLCLPGYSVRPALLHILPHLSAATAVGSVVSSTGFFFQALGILPVGQPLFGLQRVPFIARVSEYGHRASLLGYKESLCLAVEHTPHPESIREAIEQMFRTPTLLAGNYFEVSLSNSNPLLHPARLYDLLLDWHEGQVFARIPLFYEEWTERAATFYIQMDSELHQLVSSLPAVKVRIPTVLDYYESTDAATLAAKLRSIGAFKGIKAPMKAADGGFVPDFQSRYFTEDFPFGLNIIRQLARQHHVPTPTMDQVGSWGDSLLNKAEAAV